MSIFEFRIFCDMKTAKKKMGTVGYPSLVKGIGSLLEQARRAVARAASCFMTATYWEIVRRIVEFEQGGKPQRGLSLQPRVASRRATLGKRRMITHYPNGVAARKNMSGSCFNPFRAAEEFRKEIPRRVPRVGSKTRQPWAGGHNPFGVAHWTHENENPPVGIILCSSADAALARYALDALPNKVMAREYRLALPDVKRLEAELAATRRRIEKAAKQ